MSRPPLRNLQSHLTPSLDSNFGAAKVCHWTLGALFVTCLIVAQVKSADLALQTIYKFFPASSVGSFPSAWLAEGNDGNFYGTHTGYSTGFVVEDYGTVFKITPAGVLTNLFSFNGTNGWMPDRKSTRLNS